MRAPIRPAAGACVVLLAAALSSCGPSGDDDVDPDKSRAALEQQRVAVRQAARALLPAAQRALPGRAVNGIGRWDPCDERFPEGFLNFQYVIQVRIDVSRYADLEPPYLAPLRPVLEEAGFELQGIRQGPGQFQTLGGEKDGVTVGFSWSGAGQFLGFDAFGACIDVPKDQQDEWMRRNSEPVPGAPSA